MIIIDPTALNNPEHNAILSALLNDNETILWFRDRPYTVLQQDICLTHDIYLTNRQQANRSYYVLSNDLLGSGLFAEVASIECVLNFAGESLVSSEHNTLAAKIHYPIPFDSEERYNKIHGEFERQYELNRRLPHIGMEPPIYLYLEEAVANEEKVKRELQVVFVMKKMEGEELFAYLKRHYDGVETSSVKDRLTISRVLLKTFNEKFVKEKIAHRDIKGENIFLYFDARHDIQLNIFDVGHVSQDYGTPIKKQGGTVGFIAPEAQILGTMITDEKIDMFSIGVTLQTIWGFGLSALPLDESERQKRMTMVTEYFFKTDPIVANILPLIYEAIICMTDPNPESRCSIETAIQVFEFITINAESSFSCVASPVAAERAGSSATFPSPSATPFAWERFEVKSKLHKELGQRTPTTPHDPRLFVPVSPVPVAQTDSAEDLGCSAIFQNKLG